MKRSILTSLTFAICLAGHAIGQIEAFQSTGSVAGDAFGSVIVTIGDLDGDGVRDLLVGAPRTDYGGVNAGSVYALSGASGAQLYRVDGQSVGELFGSSIASFADVDGDQVADWVTGAPFASPGAPKLGRADVRSGATGSLIFSVIGIEQFSLLGTAVASTGDVDGDGLPDIVVTAPYEDSNGADAGTIRIFSSATQSQIRHHLGDAAGDRLGLVAANLGDLNADGRADYAAGSQFTSSGIGLVRVWSAQNGALLHNKLGNNATDEFGIALAAIADQDSDGKPDFLIGAPSDASFGNSAGVVRVVSGATGLVIRSLSGQVGDRLGESVADGGDWDGDGRHDVLVGLKSLVGSGEARLFSGTDSSLLATIAATATNNALGQGLAGDFDIDQDGRSEFAVGDGQANTSAAGAGELRAYSYHSVVGVSFCFGDGSGTPCPCGNQAASATGCTNSTGFGALLQGSGSKSAAADNMQLTVTGAVASTPCLLFSGSVQENGGAGVLLGDGLRCAGGAILRHEVQITGGAGGATWGPGLVTENGWSAGTTRHFQAWYRDTIGGPCSTGFNLSQGYAVQFAP